jgi:hypothetical protein
MPVVINEFEVVPDSAPPPQEPGANRGSDADAAKQKEKPPFEDVLRLWRERAERVRAH